MLYTSEIAAKALQLPPIGHPYDGPECRCAMCTRPIRRGDIADLAKMPQSFQDGMHLLPGAQYLCGWCRVTSKQSAMRMLQRCVITSDGIYSMGSDANRAWFWTDPPPPPYAVVVNGNITGAFHFHWRVPVTTDNQMVWMMLDDQVHRVNRRRVLQALDVTRRVLGLYVQDQASKLEQLESEGKKKGKAKGPEVLNSPFIMLQRDPNLSFASNHGVLKKEIVELGQRHSQIQPDVRFLQTLNPGELQALSCMLKAKPVPPEKPELITACRAEIDFEPTPMPKRPRKK